MILFFLLFTEHKSNHSDCWTKDGGYMDGDVIYVDCYEFQCSYNHTGSYWIPTGNMIICSNSSGVVMDPSPPSRFNLNFTVWKTRVLNVLIHLINLFDIVIFTFMLKPIKKSIHLHLTIVSLFFMWENHNFKSVFLKTSRKHLRAKNNVNVIKLHKSP